MMINKVRLGQLLKLRPSLAGASDHGIVFRDFHSSLGGRAESKTPSGVGFGPPFGLEFCDNYLATDYGVFQFCK